MQGSSSREVNNIGEQNGVLFGLCCPTRRTNRSALVCLLPNKHFCSAICWFASCSDDHRRRAAPAALRRAPPRRPRRRPPRRVPPTGRRRAASLQATAPTERHSVRRLLPNRRPTDAILLQSCSVLGAGSRDSRQDRAAHVIEDGIGCSGLGSLGEKACEYKLQSDVGRP